MKTLLCTLAAATIAVITNAQETPFAKSYQLTELSNLVTVIGPSKLITPSLAGLRAAGGDPVIITNPFPQIHIRKVASEIRVDVEPCCMDLDYEGTGDFRRLGCFYQAAEMSVVRNLPKLMIRAMALGSPEPEPKVPIVPAGETNLMLKLDARLVEVNVIGKVLNDPIHGNFR